MNIVVLGADGLLASDIVEMLQYDGKTTRAYSKDLCDVTNHRNLYYNLIGDTTHVINCSALNNFEKCEKDPELAKAVNDTALSKLAEICLENRIHLTHFSTANVFDGEKTEPYLESESTNPLSVLAKTKLGGEGHVLAMGDKGLVIRTNWIFGKYRTNLVNEIIHNLEQGKVTELETDEIGNPTYSSDLANAALHLSMNRKSGIYNITNTNYCSKYELGLKVAEYLNKDSNLIVKKVSNNPLIPKFSALSSFRLSKTLTEVLRPWDIALYQYLLEIGKAQ